MPPTALAARFGLILDILCRAVAARGPKGVLAVPLLILLWTRLRRTAPASPPKLEKVLAKGGASACS